MGKESASDIQDVECAIIQKDHIQICRFENSREPHVLVTDAMHLYPRETVGTIYMRWDLERANGLAKSRAKAEELLQRQLRPKSHPPSLVVFAGREPDHLS